MKSRFAHRRALSYQGQASLLLLPYLLGTLVLVVLPALIAVGVAFSDYRAVAFPNWVGLANFGRLGTMPLVRLALKNTLIFVGVAIPLRLLGALLLALLLQGRQRGGGFYRVAIFLPTIIPEAAYALVWLWILNPVYGPLNLALGTIGLPAPDWLGQAGTARLAIIIMAAFQIGEGFVVLLAARQHIPPALYDAAAVDGASHWQSFWRITLPLLLPWLFLLTFRDLLVAMQNTFAPSFILTYGGPYPYATTFLPLLLYELSFDFMDLGLASAVLVVSYLWILLLVFGIRNLVEGLRGSVEDETG